MSLELRPRGAAEVTTYFRKTDDPQITAMLPRTVTTLEQAMENFRQSQLAGAASYGRSIYFERQHIGDVWLYCLEPGEDPEAMLSFCIFEKTFWGQGLATRAVAQFLIEAEAKFHLNSIGAFCYAHNAASRRVLEKNGFQCVDVFTEDGVESCYYERGK